jgi:O-antigen ligase
MLAKFSLIFERISKSAYPENFVVLAILLFPILSLSVRHWLSGIYSLLALLALFIVFKKTHQLHKEEKILFALFALLLLSFFISASLNGWSDNSMRRLGTVLKYVLFFPLYLLIRQFKDLSSFLLTGIVAGAAILGIQSIIDIVFLGHSQVWGIYGPIIFGNLSILFFSLTLILLFFQGTTSKTSYIYIFSLILSALAVFLSGSRNAWLAAVFSIFAIPLLCYRFMKYKRTILVIIPIVIITASASLFTDTMQIRMNRAITEFQTYMAEGAPRDIPIKENSIGFRLETWRVALIITKDAFLFGYGGGNVGKHVSRYAQKGLAHQDLINPDTEKGIGGLHSTYFETLLNEGVIGLVIMMIFLLYPMYIFVKARKYSPILSTIGIIFISNYMIFGISENPFVHDNYSSVYIIFLSVFFSETIRKKYSAKSPGSVRAGTV